jgi:hypothetical protein
MFNLSKSLPLPATVVFDLLKILYTRTGHYQDSTVREKIADLQSQINSYQKLNLRFRE